MSVSERPADTAAPDTGYPTIERAVERVRSGFADGVVRDIATRVRQLEQLRRFLVEEENAITAALASDLGKSAFEAYTTEIGFTINEIDHALHHIDDWTGGERVRLPLHLRPGSGRVVPEPLGTVLIIAPWNYPLQLLLAPLVPALAAGNTAVLKPSEVAPATAELVATTLPRYLDERAVAVVTGAVPETTRLLEARFDHIFYTGNGNVGRIVMRAAAEHLTPVTLELGGKSPAIVTASADIEVAARRIAWGKFVNAGQTCVAPDYVLVDRRQHDRLVEALVSVVEQFFGEDPSTSNDYGRIVNERHHQRLVDLLDGGGYDHIAAGGTHDRSTRYIAPTILTGVTPDAAVMADEIFGPILPIVSYDDLASAIDFVNDRPKPLALYPFAEDDDEADLIVGRCPAGGVTVNHTLLHLAVPDFPFGGVGASGMGAYHGRHGFDVFSHHKPVLRRSTRLDPSLAYPPYSDRVKKLFRKLL